LNGSAELILRRQPEFQILLIRQILAAILPHFVPKGQPEKRFKIWIPVFVWLELAAYERKVIQESKKKFVVNKPPCLRLAIRFLTRPGALAR
jgi:hypothetical protein